MKSPSPLFTVDLPPVEIGPHQWGLTRAGFSQRVVALDLVFNPVALNLLARVEVLGKSVEEFIVRQSVKYSTDDEAIEAIRSCFRYQDHSREEYLAVYQRLRGLVTCSKMQGCHLVPAGEQFRLRLYNRTRDPVCVAVTLSAADVDLVPA